MKNSGINAEIKEIFSSDNKELRNGLKHIKKKGFNTFCNICQVKIFKIRYHLEHPVHKQKLQTHNNPKKTTVKELSTELVSPDDTNTSSYTESTISTVGKNIKPSEVVETAGNKVVNRLYNMLSSLEGNQNEVELMSVSL